MKVKIVYCLILLVSVIVCSLQRSLDLPQVKNEEKNQKKLNENNNFNQFSLNKNDEKHHYVISLDDFAESTPMLINKHNNMVIQKNKNIYNDDPDTNNSLDFEDIDDLEPVETNKRNTIYEDFDNFDDEITNENLIKILKTNNSLMEQYDEGNPHSFIFNVFLFYSLLYIMLIVYVLRIDVQDL